MTPYILPKVLPTVLPTVLITVLPTDLPTVFCQVQKVQEKSEKVQKNAEHHFKIYNI